MRDLPAHGLKRGDLGAVVDQFGPDAYVVEFVAGSGSTQALVTLLERSLLPPHDPQGLIPSRDAYLRLQPSAAGAMMSHRG
ncbi:MAG: DUF4926 domain-containing protein [Vicinamibacterales bacterium]